MFTCAAVLLQARYIERDLTELRAAAGAGAGWAAAAAGDAMQDMFVQVRRKRRRYWKEFEMHGFCPVISGS